MQNIDVYKFCKTNIFLNNLYVCPFNVKNIIVKKFTFTQMTFREISCLNRTSPFKWTITVI